MDAQTFSQYIGDLIGQDELDTAMEEMSRLLQQSPKLDEVVVQSARYSDLMRQIRRGTIDSEKADVNKNQIRFALLDLLREVESGATDHPEIRAEIESFTAPSSQTNIRQSHSGSGDNVGGDKIVNG